MQSPSVLQMPSTPPHFRTSKDLHYRPLSSSPLANTPRTPTTMHRHANVKRTPSTPVPSHPRYPSPRRIASSGGSVFASDGATLTPVPEDPRKTFLRDKFKARCIERAVKARQKAIQKKRRYINEGSSDDFDEMMEDEEEEDDESVMQDELFRRIMSDVNRRTQHAYRVSYAHSVASSDFDLEDVLDWEQELRTPGQSHQDYAPLELDDEEIEAYAEECAQRAALADFEDVPLDELFSLSDDEGLMETSIHRTEDVDMTP